jgi:hypothetical protein
MWLAKLAGVPLSIILSGLSPWKYIPLERAGPDGFFGVRMRELKAKDFQDTRFEYRWKSERTLNSYVCTVEIRPANDMDQSGSLPFINIRYYDPAGLGHNHVRTFAAHEISVSSVSKVAHALLTAPDCSRVDLVSWRQ